MNRHFPSHLNFDRLRFVYVRCSWKVGRTVYCGLGHAHDCGHSAASRDDVTAGRKAVNAKLAEIVGQNPVKEYRRWPLMLSSPSGPPRKPKRVHRNAGLRLAVVIGEAARDNPAARQCEVDALQRLSI